MNKSAYLYLCSSKKKNNANALLELLVSDDTMEGSGDLIS